MMRYTILAAAALALSTLAVPVHAEDQAVPPPPGAEAAFAMPEIQFLSNPDDIADAAAVNQGIETMNGKVSECIDSQVDAPEKCLCHYPEELAAAKAAYDSAIEKHPDWADKTVTFMMENGMSVNISMKNLGRQFENSGCE